MADKTRMNLKISLDLDDQLTWAELFRFVDLVRPRVNAGDRVGMEYAEQDTDILESLFGYVEPEDVLGT